MKIKGSDLRKIIKEEIQRSMLKEYSYDASNLPVNASSIARSFSRKFISLVRPGAQNALRDAITMNPDAEITFSGSVREFDTGGEFGRRLRSSMDMQSVVDAGITDKPSAFTPIYTFEEITVDGRPLPASVVDMFNIRKSEGIVVSPSRPVMFTAAFTLDELNIEDINLIGMSSEDANRFGSALSSFVSVRA